MKKLEISGFPNFLKNRVFEKMVFLSFSKNGELFRKWGFQGADKKRGKKQGYLKKKKKQGYFRVKRGKP